MKKQTVPCQEFKLFTLIEVLVVVGLVILLAGILFPHFKGAVDSSRRTKCQSNINQLMLAARVYMEAHSVAPARLEEDLKSMVSSSSVFKCPDNDTQYELFYFARETKETEAYSLGCPMHQGVQIYKNQNNDANKVCEAAQVTLDGKNFSIASQATDAQHFSPATGTQLKFEDGSTVDMGDRPVGVIASFKYTDNKYFNAIRMYEKNIPQTLHVRVPSGKGTHFIIKTPVAVAGVRGTEFEISTRRTGRIITVSVRGIESDVYLEKYNGQSVTIHGNLGETKEVSADMDYRQPDPEFSENHSNSPGDEERGGNNEDNDAPPTIPNNNDGPGTQHEDPSSNPESDNGNGPRAQHEDPSGNPEVPERPSEPNNNPSNGSANNSNTGNSTPGDTSTTNTTTGRSQTSNSTTTNSGTTTSNSSSSRQNNTATSQASSSSNGSSSSSSSRSSSNQGQNSNSNDDRDCNDDNSRRQAEEDRGRERNDESNRGHNSSNRESSDRNNGDCD